MRHGLQMQFIAAVLWDWYQQSGAEGLTYCVKDLALVQHLHKTTGTAIGQSNHSPNSYCCTNNIVWPPRTAAVKSLRNGGQAEIYQIRTSKQFSHLPSHLLMHI